MRYRRRMTGTRWLGLAFLAAAVCSMGCGRSEDRLRRDYRERSGYAEEETAFRPDLSGQGGAAVPLLLLLRLPPLLQVMPLPAPLRQLLPTMDRPM